MAYFGLAALDPEKKQLFEARRRGVDLSTLETLDAQLPALIAYAQEIGYGSFAQEAIKLRKTAARRSFDSRMHALGEASVAEIQMKSDALRAYAAEISVEGADEALTQLLMAARLREFTQEAAKYPLVSLEDCNRNLPLLETYACQIGFDGFGAWAETTRKRAATPLRVNTKKTHDASIGGDASKAGVKGKAPAKAIEMTLGFAVIALVAFGGYKAYEHFMMPTEMPSSAIVLPEETATPTPVAATLEPPAAPLPQPAASNMESSPLQQLSPAAEQAVREDFVDIKDPSVQACTDAKVADYRKEMGEDALLKYDVYNEFAVACGFNI